MKLADLNKLDFNDTGSWPLAIRVFAVALMAVFAAAAGYWFIIENQLTTLETSRTKEQQLRQQQVLKRTLLPDMGAYRKQLDELQRIVTVRLNQLPTHNEMPDLLEEISSAGKENGLLFERFKPGPEEIGDIYATKPLFVRARGRYHQFGAFLSRVTALPRIVALKQVKLIKPRSRTNREPDGDDRLLVIEATLQTYRYLEKPVGTQANGATKR